MVSVSKGRGEKAAAKDQGSPKRPPFPKHPLRFQEKNDRPVHCRSTLQIVAGGGIQSPVIQLPDKPNQNA